MKTDIITVSGAGEHLEHALALAERVAVYRQIDRKKALHLRLLAEEMMGMMRSITGEKEGKFWIEDVDNICRLHLQVATRVDSAKRDELLSASTTGRNESAKGLMGRLRDFFDRGADEDLSSCSPLMLPGVYDFSTTPTLDWEWSMMQYQDALAYRVRENDPAAKEAWDELEKSVVARVADDVKVSIKGPIVEITIIKKMA